MQLRQPEFIGTVDNNGVGGGHVDAAFDALMPVPTDTRARLVEAMRYASIGGGKRVRPLLVVGGRFQVPTIRVAKIATLPVWAEV